MEKAAKETKAMKMMAARNAMADPGMKVQQTTKEGKAELKKETAKRPPAGTVAVERAANLAAFLKEGEVAKAAPKKPAAVKATRTAGSAVEKAEAAITEVEKTATERKKAAKNAARRARRATKAAAASTAPADETAAEKSSKKLAKKERKAERLAQVAEAKTAMAAAQFAAKQAAKKERRAIKFAANTTSNETIADGKVAEAAEAMQTAAAQTAVADRSAWAQKAATEQQSRSLFSIVVNISGCPKTSIQCHHKQQIAKIRQDSTIQDFKTFKVSKFLNFEKSEF